MQPEYQRLIRNRGSRGAFRELGLGLVFLIAIVLACMLLPEMPDDSKGLGGVASAPPLSSALAPVPQEHQGARSVAGERD